ncbi:hydrogenase expression/formation protein, partial [Escherichia coli]|nr:hydrogenase expression/formation protein [Escherichia coli]
MKILVLGIGNVMFSDEGVGVHLVKLLSQKYK